MTISSSAFDQHWQQPLNIFTFVKMQGGVTEANTAALNESLKAFPNAKAQTRKEFTDNQIDGFKQVLNILYVLLALSDRRQRLRDRQHARADGVRAHARDRHAARDRPDPAGRRGG